MAGRSDIREMRIQELVGYVAMGAVLTWPDEHFPVFALHPMGGRSFYVFADVLRAAIRSGAIVEQGHETEDGNGWTSYHLPAEDANNVVYTPLPAGTVVPCACGSDGCQLSLTIEADGRLLRLDDGQDCCQWSVELPMAFRLCTSEPEAAVGD